MERRMVIHFFIHLQEGYKTFHPFIWELKSNFQTSKQKFMFGNQYSLAGYLVLNHLVPSNLGSVKGK
jgi:hypothetical protein